MQKFIKNSKYATTKMLSNHKARQKERYKRKQKHKTVNKMALVIVYQQLF